SCMKRSERLKVGIRMTEITIGRKSLVNLIEMAILAVEIAVGSCQSEAGVIVLESRRKPCKLIVAITTCGTRTSNVWIVFLMAICTETSSALEACILAVTINASKLIVFALEFKKSKVVNLSALSHCEG